MFINIVKKNGTLFFIMGFFFWIAIFASLLFYFIWGIKYDNIYSEDKNHPITLLISILLGVFFNRYIFMKIDEKLNKNK
jgi:glucan phosphoethanolaminetransferase (alkaline phosphatase superfamily)